MRNQGYEINGYHIDRSNRRSGRNNSDRNRGNRKISNGNRSGRNRRAQVLRRRVLLGVASLFLLCILTLTAGTLRSKAQGEKEQKFKYYTSMTVQSGDTLWDIAERYMDAEMDTRSSYINEVKHINHIHSEDEIPAGSILIVPYYSTEYLMD